MIITTLTFTSRSSMTGHLFLSYVHEDVFNGHPLHAIHLFHHNRGDYGSLNMGTRPNTLVISSQFEILTSNVCSTIGCTTSSKFGVMKSNDKMSLLILLFLMQKLFFYRDLHHILCRFKT